jgi:pimeloyl-ACP methyl ester carboxylesterase
MGQVAVLAHSYGTFVASRLAQTHQQRLASLCLIDPVCFGMFMPHLLYNFIYRRPRPNITK